MENTKKSAFSAVLVFMVFSLFLFAKIVCPNQQCATETVVRVGNPPDKQVKQQNPQPMLKAIQRLTSRAFDINSHDVMVVLHIQKTGGTFFGKNLVKNLDIQRPCEYDKDNMYECKRPGSNQIWLYSRYSTGWICGLHAGWTELTSCIPRVLKSKSFSTRSHRIFYITWLRDPEQRLLSEFGHVRRGATWRSVRHVCNDKEYVLPRCYKGANWINVTLQEFLNCPHNLAFNRQTRMLADMSSIGCYGKGAGDFADVNERQRAMLRSAKKNIRSVAFFGLVEYQKESQFLFEQTFNLKFREPFVQKNHTWSMSARISLSTGESRKIQGVNKLDSQLYEYAKKVFFERLEYFRTLV